MNKKRLIVAVSLVICLFVLFTSVAYASQPSAGSGDSGAGNVSTAIESSWQAAATQIKTVVNNVVFPAVDLVLAVLFFVKLATSYFEYKKHGQFEFTPVAIIFFGLIFALTAPLYLWTILGI